MKILIKGDTCNKIVLLGCKVVPEFFGLPVIENLSGIMIIGYAWFECIEKTSQKYKMPIFKFHHFKLKP